MYLKLAQFIVLETFYKIPDKRNNLHFNALLRNK